MDYDIYGDIATRTGGDIYIGVVGPVRTGKSTFITRFMETVVLPNMTKPKKDVARFEMPQSAAGKTVMTTEPKFIPGEAVRITIGNKQAKVKLIDCVGYMVDGALGDEENGTARLVSTPWHSGTVTFKEAAEYGTEKVIKEHSTLGVVVTTDGSFTDIKRESYVEAEEQVVNELKSINKPFIVIFNTTSPDSEETKITVKELEKKYGVAVESADLKNIDKGRLEAILGRVLEEFPVRTAEVEIPSWMDALPIDGKIMSDTLSAVKNGAKDVFKMKNAADLEKMFDESDVFEPISDVAIDMSTGTVRLKAVAKSGVIFSALSEAADEEIKDECALIAYVRELGEVKKNYGNLKSALVSAEADGYGIVDAQLDPDTVCKPEIVKKSGQYCVKMRADSKSLHIIRADLNIEVDPVYGTKEQCEDFVALMEEKGLGAEVFGRSLKDIVNEALQKKCAALPDGMRTKLKRVVTKAVNEKRTNLIYLLI